MIRLSRAGRESAIRNAIMRLMAEGKHKSFTQGEICRKMGITSQSKIRDILTNMVKTHQLVSGGWQPEYLNHEVLVYGILPSEQKEIEFHQVLINGIPWMSNEYGKVLKDE